MTSWWRRNAVALVALAILIPVTGVVVVGNQWLKQYLWQPVFAVEVSDAGTAELADTVWGPATAVDVSATAEGDIPAGERVIAVTIPVDPRGDAPTCLSPTLVEQRTGREWTESRAYLTTDYALDESAACRIFEDSEPVTPYEIVVRFIVPADAEGPFWVDVAPSSALPSFVRLSVEA